MEPVEPRNGGPPVVGWVNAPPSERLPVAAASWPVAMQKVEPVHDHRPGCSRCRVPTTERRRRTTLWGMLPRVTQAVATTTISQLSSSSGPPPPARNVTSWKPAASSHTTHSGGVGRRTK